MEALSLAGLATLLGLLCGTIMKTMDFTETILEKVLGFNGDFFLYLLLPPIIFHGAMQLETVLFFTHFGTISCFAILTTILSFVIVTFSVFFLTKWTLVESSAFGSLISATDPVAVLSLLQSTSTSPVLGKVNTTVSF